MTHVLIVDDKPENLYMLRALLQGHGLTVDEARDGVEALAAAKVALPDLVITDLLMPVMDGYTLLRQWKADPRLRPIPFVVYTATYTDAKDERLALDLGADAFILKPMEPEPFMLRICEMIERSNRGELKRACEAPIQETVLLKEYSEALVRKLEKKVIQLEQTNRALVAEIAERKRAEERVSLQASLLDQVRNAVLAAGPQGDVIYWNKFAETLYQWTEAEARGRDFRDLILPDAERLRANEIFAIVDKTGHWEGDWGLRRKDGSTFPAMMFIKQRNDAQGRSAGMVIVAIDVTERHRLEEQYRQAQKMEVVGKLASGVAHDFNNLLTVINGCADLISVSLRPDSTVRDHVKEISRTGERAALLIRQLLGFSRQGFGAPRVLDLNSVVLDCEKMLGRLLGEDVELTTQRDPALVPVWADAGQVEQILLNLVVNARDAMPRGGRLTLRTRNAAYGPNLLPFALLEVTDTGVGMDQATQARIFEPFFTTKGNRGTGLGLATVHDIVHTANGCVEVVSAPGAGSTFTVYLPGAQGAASAGPNPIAPAASMPQGTETVLLVEDDESVRTLTRGMLRTLGYRVLDANRAREALALSQRHPGPIHLLLTDVVMPEMSGRDLAELLVTLRPELRVLYMSGYTDDALLRHSVSRAEMAFLQKPFTPASLAAKVRESLDAVKETHR